ncbi:hypothetical protein CDAR_439342 [Caerostris darwini]|uniref:Histone-lysine N-methyltransferase NSD-like PHD zinc finger domain-containing protein n=1 Tax=Caerostris darwini TaxID=1538125 RepID=A0AAV4MHJ2_9ARAC|nr:hypothetical protein CDAR_439342 [Caerostris darwini]
MLVPAEIFRNFDLPPPELIPEKLDLPELEPESISIFFGNAPSTAGFTRLFFCFICKTSDGILHKCNDLKCKNHFHDECLAKYEKGMKSKRTCSRHICYTCEKENPKKKAGKGLGQSAACSHL